MAGLCFSVKSDPIVDHAEDEVVFRSPNLQCNLGGARMLVRVDNRLSQNSIKLRGHRIVLDIDLSFYLEPARSFPDFSLSKILQRRQQPGGIDFFLVQVARDVARVHD